MKGKHGKNLKWCQAYKLRGQREINKARKKIRHEKRMAKKKKKLEKRAYLAMVKGRKEAVAHAERT